MLRARLVEESEDTQADVSSRSEGERPSHRFAEHHAHVPSRARPQVRRYEVVVRVLAARPEGRLSHGKIRDDFCRYTPLAKGDEQQFLRLEVFPFIEPRKDNRGNRAPCLGLHDIVVDHSLRRRAPEVQENASLIAFLVNENRAT